jgi:O-antigen ligase
LFIGKILKLKQERYDWQAWDALVAVVQDYDVELVVVLMGSPSWARANNDLTWTAPPDNPQDFANFAGAFAERYGDVVHYYQVWDEPNLDDAWGEQPPKPHDYAALLQAGYQAIQSHDALATVLAAGLAPTTEERGDNISDLRYLRTLYALGANAYWDAIAGKPYGFSLSPYERDIEADVLNFSRIVAMREIMLEHGEAHKALWASNWGWNALPEDWQGETSIWGQVSVANQSFYTLDALTRATEEWAWMGGMILEHWQPIASADSARWGFAVVDQDNQPTPLWDALVSYDFDAVAQNGLYHPRSDFAEYSGVWTLGDFGADIGWLETSDSRFTFDFVGQDVSLLLREGDYFAFLYPQVDDESANATPRDNQGNSYLFLRSASNETEVGLVPVARDLTLEAHQLQVVADKGWDQWALAGIAVSGENVSVPYQRQLGLGIFTAFVSFLAMVVSGIRLPWASWLVHRLPLNVAWQYGFGLMTSLALLVSFFLAFNDSTPNVLKREMSQYGLAIILTGGLLALTLPTIGVMVTSLVLFVLIYNRLVLGVHLVLLYAPFILFPVELYQFAFPMAEYLLLLTFGAGVLRGLVVLRQHQQAGTSYRLQLRVIDFFVLAWVGLGVLAWTWSTYRGVATTELRTLFIEPALLYVLIRAIVRDEDGYQHTVFFFVVGALLASLISLGQYMMGQNIITAEEGARRLAGIYGSPNNIALYLSRALPFVIAYVFMAKYISARWRYGWGGVFVVLLGMTILLTQSVGAILLGVPMMLLVVAGFFLGRRWVFFAGGLALIGGIGTWLLAQVSARFANLFDLTSGTTFLRLRVWESATNIIVDFPITGLGLDQFLYYYRAHYIRPDAIWDADLAHPHNILLDHWIRLGIFGVILFLALQWIVWRQLVHLWQATDSHTQQWIVLGMIGSFAGLLAHGLVDNGLFYPDLMLVFMMQLGILTNWRLQTTRSIDANTKG